MLLWSQTLFSNYSTEHSGEGTSPGDVVGLVEVESRGTRAWMLMPWTIAGAAG